MDARFGFNAVPKWRAKGVLGVALSAALFAETLVATTEVYAAPAAPEAEAEQSASRGPDGTLQAPETFETW